MEVNKLSNLKIGEIYKIPDISTIFLVLSQPVFVGYDECHEEAWEILVLDKNALIKYWLNDRQFIKLT